MQKPSVLHSRNILIASAWFCNLTKPDSCVWKMTENPSGPGTSIPSSWLVLSSLNLDCKCWSRESQSPSRKGCGAVTIGSEDLGEACILSHIREGPFLLMAPATPFVTTGQ